MTITEHQNNFSIIHVPLTLHSQWRIQGGAEPTYAPPPKRR